MTVSVQFDGTELRNATYVPRYVKHDSAPPRELEILELAREDGGILISERYKPKTILIHGVLTAGTRELLEQYIDEFKELISRKNKNLDISYRGETRRYVAYARNHNLERDFFHNLFVPYDIEFVVPGSIGKSTSETAARDSCNVTTTYDASVTLEGSARPKPNITLLFGSGWTNACGISFEQTDLDEKIIYNNDAAFSDGDILIIDTENRIVTLNGVEKEFYRVFPSFVIGENKYQIKAGNIIDQQFIHTDGELGQVFPIGYQRGQSFTVPHTDETYQGISLRLKTGATTTGSVLVEIQTDSDGDPSGSSVANASFTIPYYDIGTDFSWVFANSTSKFTLSANTVYWIVASIDGDHYDTEISLITGADADYGRGHYASSDDGGATWSHSVTDDIPFKLFFGGKADSPQGVLTLDIDYYKRWL